MTTARLLPLIALALLAVPSAALSAGAEDEVTEKTKAEEAVDVRDVVVPKDNKPFTVEENDIVRLVGRGIAGSTITPDVTGPAKVIRAYHIRQLVDGRSPIGGQEREFEILPTGKGEVTVTITVKYPTGSPPKVEKYRFTVE
jgi:hypothetical protein